MNSEKSVILQFFIDSNENPTLHTFNTCFILLQIDKNTPMYTFGDIDWTQVEYLLRFHSFYKLWKVCHFYNFSSIRTKTRRCTPSIHALAFCGLIITLQCILLEIQPGHEVEYLLSFHIFYEFWKVCHFYNFSLIRTKIRRCIPSISVLSVCTIWKLSIENFWRCSLDTRSNIY